MCYGYEGHISYGDAATVKHCGELWHNAALQASTASGHMRAAAALGWAVLSRMTRHAPPLSCPAAAASTALSAGAPQLQQVAGQVMYAELAVNPYVQGILHAGSRDLLRSRMLHTMTNMLHGACDLPPGERGIVPRMMGNA